MRLQVIALEGERALGKYFVTIEETVSQTVEIVSDSAEQAKATATAIEEYCSGKLVLEPGDLIGKKIQVHNGSNEMIGWEEF